MGNTTPAMLTRPCSAWHRVTQTRAFDTESAGSSYASGFIVDAKRGLILTNRHVVSPGADWGRLPIGGPIGSGHSPRHRPWGQCPRLE